MLKRYAPFILALGDVLALALFVLVGQRDHETLDAANPILGLLPDVLAFAIPWLVSAYLLRAFRLNDANARQFFARTLNAWLVATLFGLLLRSFILGRAVIPTLFVVAALGFGGLFLFAWRVIFLLLWRRTQVSTTI